MVNNQIQDNISNANHALDSVLSRDLQSHLPSDVRHILEAALSAQQAVFAQEKIELTEIITTQITTQITAQITAQITTQLTAEFHAKIQLIYEQITLARRRMFGPRSDADGQTHLFNEAETTAEANPPEFDS